MKSEKEGEREGEKERGERVKALTLTHYFQFREQHCTEVHPCASQTSDTQRAREQKNREIANV